MQNSVSVQPEGIRTSTKDENPTVVQSLVEHETVDMLQRTAPPAHRTLLLPRHNKGKAPYSS